MELFIQGIGTCAFGFDEEMKDTTAKLADIPIKEYAKPALRRRYGRVTKMMHVAACRAIEDADVSDPSSLAIVASTAMGEVEVGLKLLTQLYETRGVRIGPALVSNSVHNAPAGHMSIAFKSKAPAVTVSQGWLSAEAALVTASDLLGLGVAESILVVVGDEADPSWEQSLRDTGAQDLSRSLELQVFQEGAAAMIVSLQPGAKSLGTVAALLERAEKPTERILEIIEKNSPREGLQFLTRTGANGKEIVSPQQAVELDGPGIGTSQTGALAQLFSRIKDPTQREILILAREIDDVGVLHWKRQPKIKKQ